MLPLAGYYILDRMDNANMAYAALPVSFIEKLLSFLHSSSQRYLLEKYAGNQPHKQGDVTQ